MSAPSTTIASNAAIRTYPMTRVAISAIPAFLPVLFPVAIGVEYPALHATKRVLVFY